MEQIRSAPIRFRMIAVLAAWGLLAVLAPAGTALAASATESPPAVVGPHDVDGLDDDELCGGGGEPAVGTPEPEPDALEGCGGDFDDEPEAEPAVLGPVLPGDDCSPRG